MKTLFSEIWGGMADERDQAEAKLNLKSYVDKKFFSKCNESE